MKRVMRAGLIRPAMVLLALPATLHAQDRGAQSLTGDSAAVTAVVESARGANAVMCELAARTVESQWGWGNGQEIVRAPRDATARSAVQLTRGRATPPGSVPVLAAALRDEDACVRRLAAPLLGRVKHASGFAALRTAMQDERPATREAAAIGLGYTNDVSVIPALLAGLQDAEARVRVACAWGLGEIEDRRAVGALVRLLREDRDPDVRAAAAWAIGSIEG